jgi:putative peptidoglycan lipid II flippase
MFNRFFNFQSKNVASAAIILSASSLISRLLGLYRDRLLAGKFGAGSDLDVYFAAFRVPDFIYNILIAGGIVVALLPLFSEYFIKDKNEAWKFINNVLNIFFVLLIFISGIVAIFAPFIVKIITPGFSQQEVNLTVLLTRILFLSPILLGLSSVFSGVLQYFNRFLAYSLAPILYNLGIIIGIVFFTPFSGIIGVTIGVILGAFFHFAIQVPSAIKAGFSYKPILNFKDSKIKKVFTLLVARTFGVAAPQLNLMVVTAIASLLPAGALSIFTLSNNIQQFPLGLIGIPFAVAVFPALSNSFTVLNREEYLKNFYSTFKKIIYLTVPLSIIVFIFRQQIIEIIYKAGRFDQNSVLLLAASFGIFALGFWATTLIPLILRAFFSFQDTKTPTIVSIVTMIINITFCFTFVWLLGFSNGFHDLITKIFFLPQINNISVVGLPMAFAASSIFEFAVLMILLNKKIAVKFPAKK